MEDKLEKKVNITTPINFENGDFLVVKDRKGEISIGPIISIYIYGEGTITAEIGGEIRTVGYADAVILKNDGTYLLGKNLQEQLAQSKDKALEAASQISLDLGVEDSLGDHHGRKPPYH